MAVVEKSGSSLFPIATFERLEEHGIVLITPAEEFKFASITLAYTFSSNYVYLYIHVAGRSCSHVLE